MPDVRVLSSTRASGDGPVRMFATVRIGPVVVRGVRLVQKKSGDGHFIGWPSRKNGEGYEDVAFVAESAERDALLAAVLEEYKTKSGGEVPF